MGVPVPPKGTPAAQEAHTAAARLQARSLVPRLPASADTLATAERAASLGPDALIASRRSFLAQVRALATSLRGSTAEAISVCSPGVQQVLAAASDSGVHVSLLRAILTSMQWPDMDVVDCLLTGFPLVGDMPVGLGPEAPTTRVRSAVLTDRDLRLRAPSFSPSVVARHLHFKDDAGDSEILRQTIDEVLRLRMTPLEPLHESHLNYVLTRRFAVSQLSAKGLVKLRMIDDFAESGVNSATSVSHRIRMGRLSSILRAASVLRARHPSLDLDIGKGDFSAAYRSLPVLTGHLDLSSILVKGPRGLLVSRQLAMPFGAVASVYAWHRLGGAAAHIISTGLSLPLDRYVDDLFWVDFAQISLETRDLVVELVQLLGLRLDEEKTPAPSSKMAVLGVLASLDHHPDGSVSVDRSPDPPRVSFWLKELDKLASADSSSRLEIQRLVGRLSFAVSAALGPSCRGRLRPLHDWANIGGGFRSQAATRALAWWTRRLSSAVPRTILLTSRPSDPVLVYTDAEGNGGLGVVVFDGTFSRSFSTSCPASVLAALAPRKTQINPLEMIGVWLALSYLPGVLRNREVVFFVDNLVALHVLAKGTSRKVDLNSISLSCWAAIDSLGIVPSFVWVPSALNSADGPSRGDHRPDMVPVRPRWEKLLADLRD